MKRVHGNIAESSLTARGVLREQVERLYSRVGLLSGRDKVLMTMYLKNGSSFRQIARLTGVSEGAIARRIHTISKRLIDGEYITCLRNRDLFTAGEMELAKEHFLLGLSIKKLAARHKQSFYQIRKDIKRIQKIVGMIRQHEGF